MFHAYYKLYPTPIPTNLEIHSTTCAHPCDLEPIAKWKCAKLIDKGVTDHKAISCKKGVFVEAFKLPFNRVGPPTVFTSCSGNEIAGFRNRYLKPTEPLRLKKDVLNTAINDFLEIITPHFDSKIAYEDFLNAKHGQLGQRYLRATKQLLEKGFDVRRDSKVTPFVKKEKIFDDTKPPRLVYARDPIFNILYALYTVPLEHALVKLPQVAKGCNFLERGEKFSRLLGSWLCENDYSKFESTQRVQLYDMIQNRIFRHFYGNDAHLFKLLEAKLHKRGTTLRGVMFEFFGMMGSGEMDTGLFNTIFNWIACRYFEIVNGLGKGEFLVDGDDGVIKVPVGCVPINCFSDFGFTAKLIVRPDYHDVEFCSSKFMQVSPGVYYQVQDLTKLLASIPYMINEEFIPHLDTYYSSLGFMYDVIYHDIPVYSDMAKFLQTCNINNRRVCTTMTQKATYGASEAFSHGKQGFVVDKDLCLIELSLLFNLGLSEIDYMRSWFNTHSLLFPSQNSLPYKLRQRKMLSHKNFRFEDLESVDFVGNIGKRPAGYRDNSSC
jgi:hypothetical protein